MASITLAQANLIATTALAKGRDLALKPLTVAVLDAGGHLVTLQREDTASNMRPQIAIGKASSALALGLSSRLIAEMALERPTFIAALSGLTSSGIVPAAGGVIIVDENGGTLGAVGITGDSSDNDEICALAGISKAKLAAQG